MELQIPQSFKVQWLNTTLKFIKDDTQLIKDYPEMPSSHVEYLHNLIWQRKYDVGLGFKSLYSPVWEAMKIHSLKYQFKIEVKKSEDGRSGHLIMEKIPKTSQLAKKLNDIKKERDNETVQNYEVIKKSQSEVIKCKQAETQLLNKLKTNKPHMSEGQKKLMENQKMLDSLSPLFIKKTLKLILDFICDELSASKIFSNLAPIESRFLENFLSIYQRKNDLEVLLSPACNEILAEISNCFDNFNKTFRLEISSVGVNSKTNKREVKFTKVPVFPSIKKANQKLKEHSIQTKTPTSSSNDTTKLINMPSISKEEHDIMVEKNKSEETNKNKSINQTKILQYNAISKDRLSMSQPIDKVIDTVDKNVIEALSTFVKKPEDVKPTSNFNKSVPLPEKNINFTKEGASSTADSPHIRVGQKSPEKKCLQDMTVPLNSRIAISVPLPEESISFTKEETSSTADSPYIREQKSPQIKILQDMTLPLNSDKAMSQNPEVTKNSEVIKCKQAKSKPSHKTKTMKPLPQMSEGLKKFMENQKILDSLSPLFIKTTLTSILDFICDELSASKIFSNLAPIESRFLENFLSIYQRKNDLEVLLSPACNELLAEVSNCFDDFNKTLRLEISSLGVNSNTNKREVKYTKEPVFPKKKKSKQKLNEQKQQTKTPTISPNNTTKLINMPSMSKEDNITMEKKLSDTNKSISNNQSKILQNNTICEDRLSISQPIDKVIKNRDNNITAVSTIIKKPEDVKPKTNLNKSVLLPKKSISFTKERNSSTDTPYVKVVQKSSKLKKILQDMTVPITSEKGIRMMQLMGWEGGALGLRGDGITEPIIPTPNFNTRGLGHVPVKKESIVETKKQIRSEFVNRILKMIDNDVKVSVIRLQNKLINREIQFLHLTLDLINRRRNLDIELNNRIEIIHKMMRNMNIMFYMEVEDDNRKIIITKISKTITQAVQRDTKKDTNCEKNNTNAIQNPDSKATLKIIVLKAILELIKSKDDEKVIKFNKQMKVERFIYSNTIILLINERQHIKQNNNQVVAQLGSQVLKAIGDIILSVKIYEDERYIVIRKQHPRNNVDLKINKPVVKKAESYDYNKSAFDDVRSNLPTKKKNKILNALYRYEMQHTEEFKENRWYNIVNNSLLDSEKMCDINATITVNNDEKSENNKNNKRKIEYDHNNNGGLTVTFKI